jgi:hypothetical protein
LWRKGELFILRYVKYPNQSEQRAILQPPPRETWHGTLLGYTIRWWEVSEEGKGSSDKPGSESGASADATSTTIRGLKAATRYGLTVRAYNAAGTGPLSPPHYRHTLESRKLFDND